MALFMKQDFSPPILSRKWFAIRFRPNVMLHSREHVIAILESGLLFREDSIEAEKSPINDVESRLYEKTSELHTPEISSLTDCDDANATSSFQVEQEAPPADAVWRACGGARGGWFTRGERAAAAAALAVCAAAWPPRSLNRSALIHITTLATIPLCIRLTHRLLSRRTPLRKLLSIMRDYLALSRRAQACVKELGVLCRNIESIQSLCSHASSLLTRQQAALSVLMSRASSALLGNAPWLRADVAWEPLEEIGERQLMKVHHAFLVIQSTLLKHIAMAHFILPSQTQQVYKNHNERIYWLHSVIIEHLHTEFVENFEALDRMYRLLKNVANKDQSDIRKPGFAVNDNWLYSDVHSNIATACLELKLSLNKCTSLDLLLDSISQNQQELDLEVLSRDVDDLVEGLTRCLGTTQSAQIRLNKLRSKFGAQKQKKIETSGDAQPVDDGKESEGLLKIEDKEPEVRDEVFYFVKTEDDAPIQQASDVTTGPGKKERETTKFVLNELKRKLVKREDLMRERERQALVNTMPELKDNLPEFPRQISLDNVEKKGYTKKLTKRAPKKLNSFTKIKTKKHLSKVNALQTRKYTADSEIPNIPYEAKSDLKHHKSILTISKKPSGFIDVTKWYKDTANNPKRIASSESDSEGVEIDIANKTVHQAVNNHFGDRNTQQNGASSFKFTKKDLELTPSTSETDEDFNFRREDQTSLLADVRRHRVARRKNYPVKRRAQSIENKEVDESLKPMEYSFGTGMAMASVLQVNRKDKLPNLAQEEVFIGDGEVSADSANEADA